MCREPAPSFPRETQKLGEQAGIFALTAMTGGGGGTRVHTQVAQLEQLQLGRHSEGSYVGGPEGWRLLNAGGGNHRQVGRRHLFCEYSISHPAPTWGGARV